MQKEIDFCILNSKHVGNFTNFYTCVKMFKNAFNLFSEDNKPTNIVKQI
jgi:hypothetical protein